MRVSLTVIAATRKAGFRSGADTAAHATAATRSALAPRGFGHGRGGGYDGLVRALAVILFAVIAAGACSGSSSCPADTPSSGDACGGGGAVCGYGPVTCTCTMHVWQCELPFIVGPTDDGGGDDGPDYSDYE